MTLTGGGRLNNDQLPLVSTVIISYNSEAFLTSCIKAILSSDYPEIEVIVVDNQSRDGSCDLVEKNFPDVKLIRNTENLGHGGGANTGLGVAKGDYVMFMNPDVTLDKSCIRNLVLTGSQDPRAAVMGCKAVDSENRKRVQFAWGVFRKNRWLGVILGENEVDDKRWSTEQEVGWVLGGALMVKRDSLEKLSLYDDLYFLYYEELDICFRAIKAGRKVLYVPTATVYRDRNSPARSLYTLNKGRILFALKNLNRDELFGWGSLELRYLRDLFRLSVSERRVRGLWLPLLKAYGTAATKIRPILQRRVIQADGNRTGFVSWAGAENPDPWRLDPGSMKDWSEL